MTALISAFSAGSVATINADGTPSVSPKATFIVMDDKTLAFGNLRSPRTVANLRRNPAIEICFTDILRRRAVRVTGTAQIVSRKSAPPDLVSHFETAWKDYVPRMSDFVVIDVNAAEMILSPAYDIGFTEEELRAVNLKHLQAL